MNETPAALRRRVDAALAARAARPAATIIPVLERAADHWAADPRLAELTTSMQLSAPMVTAIVQHVRQALRAADLQTLVDGDIAAGAGSRPAFVGHVLASNVPALAVAAIAHACLVGAAVVVKSGRADRVSAPAFRDAIAAVDPALAATIVPAYWAGGQRDWEVAAFSGADVVVGTGTDATVTALTDRLESTVLGHGERTSVLVIAQSAPDDVEQLAAHMAYDIALYDQRGCLSPHAIFVEQANQPRLDRLATALLRHLERLAAHVPPGPTDPAGRAIVRRACDDAEWAAGAQVRRAPGGTVVLDPRPHFVPAIGGRTVRLQPLGRLADLPTLLPAGQIESVGAAGDVTAILPALRALGVSRVCRPGTMQTPPIYWPRGQRAPLAALRGASAQATMLVELP